MSPWRALVCKDVSMMRASWMGHLAGVGGLGLFLTAAAVLHAWTPGPRLTLWLITGAVSAVALPLYAYMGLAREWRQHASGWLGQTPPGWMLLASKLAAAAVCALSAWALYAAWTGVLLSLPRSLGGWPLAGGPAVLWGTAVVLLLGLYAGVWLMALALAVQGGKRLGVGRFGLALAVAAVPLGALPNLAGLSWLQPVLAWRARLPVQGTALGSAITLHGGQLLVPLAVTAGAFWAATWVLDRWVEA